MPLNINQIEIRRAKNVCLPYLHHMTSGQKHDQRNLDQCPHTDAESSHAWLAWLAEHCKSFPNDMSQQIQVCIDKSTQCTIYHRCMHAKLNMYAWMHTLLTDINSNQCMTVNWTTRSRNKPWITTGPMEVYKYISICLSLFCHHLRQE